MQPAESRLNARPQLARFSLALFTLPRPAVARRKLPWGAGRRADLPRQNVTQPSLIEEDGAFDEIEHFEVSPYSSNSVEIMPVR